MLLAEVSQSPITVTVRVFRLFRHGVRAATVCCSGVQTQIGCSLLLLRNTIGESEVVMARVKGLLTSIPKRG